MTSGSTPSAMEPAKDLILVQTVQLTPMIKALYSGGMTSSGINDVVIAAVHFEKTRLKKLMMMMMMMMIMMMMMMIIIMDNLPETDFCRETEARKVVIDFKYTGM